MGFFRDKDGNRRRLGCFGKTILSIAIYLLICGVLGWWLDADSVYTPEPNSVYLLKMEGTVVEQGREENPLESVLAELPGANTQTAVGLDDLLSNIRLAKSDDNIRGIYLKGGQFQMGHATAKALRDALVDFKSSGKFIIAYSDAYEQTNYYVSSVADRIYLNEVGVVDWKGITTQKMYYKRLLEKIGVKMQIIKVGSFKSAVEPYIRTSMSEADRRQTQMFQGGIWRELKRGVSESRGLSEETLDRYADMYMALRPKGEYLSCGLVDSLCYVQDMDSVLAHAVGTAKFHLVKTSEMNRVVRPKEVAKDKVAIIYADGEIVDSGSDGIVESKMLRTIRKVGKDKDVRAVVLRVNSPGGSADASEQIWHGVQTLREKGMPVVVSMGDLAASGGYYISCGADYIFAEPNTLTGSIGIFGTIPCFADLRDKVGMDIDGVSTNAHSDLEVSMIYRGLNTAEEAMFQSMIEQGYDLFTRRCAEGRHMTQAQIKQIAEGRVWLGEDALRIGLVDELGGIEAAIAKAAELAGVEEYRRVSYPERKDFLQEVLETLDKSTPEEKLMARIRTFVEKPRVMAKMEDMIIK